jgi:hypothetical protein
MGKAIYAGRRRLLSSVLLFRRSLRSKKKNALCGGHVRLSIRLCLVSAAKIFVRFPRNLVRRFFKNRYREVLVSRKFAQ